MPSTAPSWIVIAIGVAGCGRLGFEAGGSDGREDATPVVVQLSTPFSSEARASVERVGFAMPPGAGNAVIVMASGWQQELAASASEFSDDQGGSYELAIRVYPGGGNWHGVYFRSNIAAGADPLEVAWTNAEAGTKIHFRAMEVAGLAVTDALDRAASALADSPATMIDVATPETTTQPQLAVASISTWNGTTLNFQAQEPGWTQASVLDGGGGGDTEARYKVISTPGVVTQGWTFNAAGNGVGASIATFRAAPR
jgi:hypothetical protein